MQDKTEEGFGLRGL